MVDSLVSSFRAQLRFSSSSSSASEGPLYSRSSSSREAKTPGVASSSPQTGSSTSRKVLSLTEGRAIPHGFGVFELPRAVSLEQAQELKRQVDEKYDQRGWTDRGASLSTHDIFVRDLACKDVVYQAIDACCHAVEKITGNLVTYNRHEVFVIVYDASQQPGLEKHRDGTSKAQRNTVLIALDNARTDYVGGGTRFYPEKPGNNNKDNNNKGADAAAAADTTTTAKGGGQGGNNHHRGGTTTFMSSLSSSSSCSSKTAQHIEPFAVQPEQGGSVIFPPDLMHEGIPISTGRRHVIAIFTKDGSSASFGDKQKLRKEQYEAALAFELQAIKESVMNRIEAKGGASTTTATTAAIPTASGRSVGRLS